MIQLYSAIAINTQVVRQSSTMYFIGSIQTRRSGHKSPKWCCVLTFYSAFRRASFGGNLCALKIAKKKKRYQFVTLGVDSVALHHTLVYVWETLQGDDSMKNQHQLLSLTDFWRSLEKAKFPLMRIHTKRMMSLFNKPLFSNLFA